MGATPGPSSLWPCVSSEALTLGGRVSGLHMTWFPDEPHNTGHRSGWEDLA